MSSDSFISVIIPLEKVNQSIIPKLESLSKLLVDQFFDHEIVLVDTSGNFNSCVDSLLPKIPCIRYLRLGRQHDIEIAITAGLDTVIGDYVVVMRLETDPIDLVSELISQCQNEYDVVYGIRQPDNQDFFLNRLLRHTFSWFCRRILNVEWIHRAMHFRCMSRQVVNSLVQIKDHHRCLRTNSLSAAGKTKAIHYIPLKGHNDKRTFLQNAHYALSVISQNSFHPLRMATVLGIFAIASNCLYLFYIIGVWIFKENIVEGWVSSTLPVVAHFLLFSIILTIVSEYLGTILTRLQHRPLYSISDEKCSNVKFISEDMRNVVDRSFLSDSN